MLKFFNLGSIPITQPGFNSGFVFELHNLGHNFGLTEVEPNLGYTTWERLQDMNLDSQPEYCPNLSCI